MRGLTRILVMFAPMIIRNVSKYYKQWQSKKSAEQQYAQEEPYNEVEDRLGPDKGTLDNGDLV